MRVYVNEEFMNYVATFYGAVAGDEYWCQDFDVNGDGKIDLYDITWFAQRGFTWIEIGVGANPLIYAGLTFAGIVLGYVVARVL